MGLKSFSTLVKEGTLQSSGDDSIPAMTNAPVAPTIARKYIKGTPENKALKASRKPINGHPTGKYNEEVETIEEAYAKVETKKYSWGTMKTAHHGASFSVPMHPEHHKAIHSLSDNQEHKFKTEDGRHWTAKRQGDDVHLHSANDGPKTKIKHSDLKEEVEQIEEANHREFASQGKMHPDMAKHMKTGQEMDFYHSKTGDKVSGVVKHVSPSEVHIKAHKDGKMGAGEVHKFKVSSKLDEAKSKVMDMPTAVIKQHPLGVQTETEEGWENAKIAKKINKESYSVADLFQALKEGMWPGTPEYKAKYDGAKQGGGAGVKKGSRYGGSLQKDEPETEEEPAKAGRKVGSKSGARKNLGNSKLHK